MAGRCACFALWLLVAVGVAQGATPVKVGVLLPLSGDLAEFGQAAQNGLEMAREAFGKDFQEKVEIVYEDTQYDAAQSAAAARKLIVVDHADALVVWGEAPASAIVEMAEASKVPTLAVAINPKLVDGKRYALRALNGAGEYVSPLLRFLKEDGRKRLGVVYVEDPYFLHLRDALHSGNSGVVTTEEQVPAEQSDFRAVVAKLKRQDLDAIAVYLNPGQLSTFCRQASGMKLDVRLFGADSFESESEIKAAEGGMEGAVYTHNAVLPDFRERYTRRFNNDIQLPYAAISYASGELLQQALSDAPPEISSDEIMNRLRVQTGIESQAVGRVDYVQTKNDSYFRFPVVVKEIRGGSSRSLY